MRSPRWIFVSCALVAACATAATNVNVRPPLAAVLSPGATLGVPAPLRHDPNAKVILSTAAGLPPASFLPSQAARGEAVYSQTCGACHQPGQLIGQGFVESWNDRRVFDFYSLVRGTMPLDNPGGLKDQEYLDVVAYLLQANHHASPARDSLRADTVALRGTKISVHFP
jgi:S-disulfanyl-L-cysteine oxidoreductase SoxD